MILCRAVNCQLVGILVLLTTTFCADPKNHLFEWEYFETGKISLGSFSSEEIVKRSHPQGEDFPNGFENLQEYKAFIEWVDKPYEIREQFTFINPTEVHVEYIKHSLRMTIYPNSSQLKIFVNNALSRFTLSLHRLDISEKNYFRYAGYLGTSKCIATNTSRLLIRINLPEILKPGVYKLILNPWSEIENSVYIKIRRIESKLEVSFINRIFSLNRITLEDLEQFLATDSSNLDRPYSDIITEESIYEAELLDQRKEIKNDLPGSENEIKKGIYEAEQSVPKISNRKDNRTIEERNLSALKIAMENNPYFRSLEAKCSLFYFHKSALNIWSGLEEKNLPFPENTMDSVALIRRFTKYCTLYELVKQWWSFTFLRFQYPVSYNWKKFEAAFILIQNMLTTHEETPQLSPVQHFPEIDTFKSLLECLKAMTAFPEVITAIRNIENSPKPDIKTIIAETKSIPTSRIYISKSPGLEVCGESLNSSGRFFTIHELLYNKIT